MSPADLDSVIVRPTIAVAVIVATSRLLGLAFRRRGQPQVIGEFLAGLLLGPSFFGWVAPGAYTYVFSAEVLPFLKLLSDYGIMFFMFLVGLELDPQLLRKSGRSTLAIATASIAVPLAIGAATGWTAHGALAPAGVRREVFAVFFAVSLSITAFPVLARILIERDMAHTGLGSLALACAAINDLSAWCLLAGLLALSHGGDGWSAASTALRVTAALAVLLAVAPRVGVRMELLRRNRGELTQDILALVLLLLFAAALLTHWAGIHVIFGAFLLGATLPKGGPLARDLADKTEDLTTVFLLPVYFAYTGIRTDLRLLESPAAWLTCALVIAVATAGKLAGSGLAARWVGMPWRQALALGALMNTRGLMELVILNVGLDLHIVDAPLFAIMVLMAVVTTLAATPAVDALCPASLRRGTTTPEGVASRGTVLIPVAFSASGPPLLDLARGLAAEEAPRIYALHVPRPVERGVLGADAPRPETSSEAALAPLLAHAREHGLEPRPLVITSNNPAATICEVARVKQAELIVMGWHRPAFRRSVLSGALEQVMRDSAADVAVFVDRGRWLEPRRILVPYTGTAHDRAALRRALTLARRARAEVVVLHVVRDDPRAGGAGGVIEEETDRPAAVATRLIVVRAADPLAAVLEHAADVDLIVIGIGGDWDLTPGALGIRQERIAAEAPVPILIIRGGTFASAHPNGRAGPASF